MSKFSEFLNTNKIDPRRILAASHKIEKLRPEDRQTRLKKRQAKASEKKPEGDAPPKPRSGRPVTNRLLAALQAGKPVTGPQKTRVLRAVNRVLEQKKKDPADLRKLF